MVTHGWIDVYKLAEWGKSSARSIVPQMQFSFGHGIHDLEKRKSMEIRVSGANPANAMFTHQDCRMGIMEQIASQIRELREDLSGHLSMA
jgi:hypothetical protein